MESAKARIYVDAIHPLEGASENDKQHAEDIMNDEKSERLFVLCLQ